MGQSPPHSPVHPRRSLSLILPAYNEEAVIGQAISEAAAALANLVCRYEVLVVDDGSQDATSHIALAASRSNPRVRLLRHPVNRGYGAALRTGFDAAQYELVSFTDADCQFDLNDLGALLALCERFPLVVGYRLQRQDSWRRRFFSRGYNLLTGVLLGTGVRDCDCALKIFSREVLRPLRPQSTGFFVNTEILTRARLLGYPVAEVGVRHRPRLGGSSKVSLTDIPRTLAVLLPFWWRHVVLRGGQPATVETARV
jgi:glycosyltransferase involved in cell wall biosynthesis